ncbi:MAG: molybdopterin-guanine dinucleotide biosynthesis protein B [Thermoplasmata archaeon]|nr:molybdopterin-guanine dinucleotide biosynthesis protein B [Thermoplasmata archaeon]
MIIVSLIGLKKSGKTTTAEALISEFKARGYKIGGVKWMVQAGFTIDTEGKDTWRQKRAGADFVISMSKDELALIQNRPERPSFDDILALVPDDTDILICEGVETDHPDVIKMIIAKSPELLADTFEVRDIGDGVIALSGIIANEITEHPDYPVFNCTEPDGVKGLADLILASAGGGDGQHVERKCREGNVS